MRARTPGARTPGVRGAVFSPAWRSSAEDWLCGHGLASAPMHVMPVFAMVMNIHGKTIVVTGASSGIGRATALEAARRGMNVALAARRSERLEALAA